MRHVLPAVRQGRRDHLDIPGRRRRRRVPERLIMDTPLVVAALRWVDLRPAIDPLTGAVRTDPLGSGLSAADESALEHALRLSDALGGRCVAVTAGPPQAEDVLRHALSVGATDALRVAGTLDTEEHVAAALVEAITSRHGAPSVLLCGDHSADRGTGATPAFLAALLGARQALGLVRLDVDPDGRLLAERRLDGGRRERLAATPPVVCSIEPTGTRLRRAPLPSVLAARHAGVPVATPESTVDDRVRLRERRAFRPRTRAVPAPAGAAPNARVLALTGALTEREPPRLVYPANAAEAADELIGYLRQRGYLP
ncbi:MAG: putative mycofactocin-associated electron transfer flavoprotein [Pseudonocardiaceae bacterium]|nr:putative mycofactocin-associated electron transfer flavoprotein [Pseudonocardiaceae bacterium]